MPSVLSHTLRHALRSLGEYCLLTVRAFSAGSEFRLHQKSLLPLMARIGVNAIPVVILAGAFSGVVLTVQTAYMLASSILTNDAIGAVVVPSLMLELSPLVTGLVMASRAGASIAAELGTMKVTEQVDALEAMGLNATAYLVVPRVLAGTLTFPLLYVAGTSSGIAFGAFAGSILDYLTVQTYVNGAQEFFFVFDVFFGLIKTGVFGFVITSIACWKGLTATGGAEGVGRCTTEAVVLSCVMILFVDYLLAELLL